MKHIYEFWKQKTLMSELNNQKLLQLTQYCYLKVSQGIFYIACQIVQERYRLEMQLKTDISQEWDDIKNAKLGTFYHYFFNEFKSLNHFLLKNHEL